MPMPWRCASRGDFGVRLIAEQHAARISAIKAHDAFYERALTGAVFAQQSVKAAGFTRNDTSSSATKLPKRLEMPCASKSAGSAFTRVPETAGPLSVETAAADARKRLQERARGADRAEHTVCMVTIFSAAAWFQASVAAQQSPRMRHS